MFTNLLSLFQSFRTIMCLCPHCGDILRLSDLQLRYDGKCSTTWLDYHDGQERRFDIKLQKFEEMENQLRDQATERGRKKVPSIIRKSMSAEFTKLRYDPYDIKALLHPVDFVVFNGMNNGRMLKDVVFLSKRTESLPLIRLRKSVEETITKCRYEWELLRVNNDGKIEREVSDTDHKNI